MIAAARLAALGFRWEYPGCWILSIGDNVTLESADERQSAEGCAPGEWWIQRDGEIVEDCADLDAAHRSAVDLALRVTS